MLLWRRADELPRAAVLDPNHIKSECREEQKPEYLSQLKAFLSKNEGKKGNS